MIMDENLIEIKQLILEQTKEIVKLNDQLKKALPKKPLFINLSNFAKEINKSNQTIMYHLQVNYEPEKDFKKINGKIVIDSRIVPIIKEHYEKK